MVAKTILYEEEARKALERGMDTLAEAVSITLGPKGRNVVLGKKFGTITLGFDVGDLAAERVYYDEKEGSIVLRNPPADFVEEIKKAQGISVPNNE